MKLMTTTEIEIKPGKYCPGCKDGLPVDEFNKDRSRADGRCDRCRKCESQRAEKYRNSEQGKLTLQRYRKDYISSEHGQQVKSKYQKKYQKTLQGKKVDRRAQLKYLHELTPEQYRQMYLDQKGCCGICGEYRSEKERNFDIDHDPHTWEPRGLLCWKCNQLLGRYENGQEFKPEITEKLEAYLSPQKC